MKEKELKALGISGLLVMWQAIISIFTAISSTCTISTTVIFVTAKTLFEDRISRCVDHRCCEGDCLLNVLRGSLIISLVTGSGVAIQIIELDDRFE
ncbi:MAG: hypothetical protein GYA51_00500 [Candidatus Methanofastidiosa archaeon]|nr:hypothetical protein [Candidatus Methanofastidiosa archaeon]